jgi:hypothetical protein
MSNFIEDCLHGNALLEDVDDYVDRWHESKNDIPIYKFLGMTDKEYELWVADPNVLPFIVKAHRDGKNVYKLVEEFDPLPLAARAAGPDRAKKLIRWLKAEGHIK